MICFLYILYSKNHIKTYTGISNDLQRRINEHNAGRSKFTKKFMPWKLIYSECLSNRQQAREREKYFKSAAGRKKIKVMMEEMNII